MNPLIIVVGVTLAVLVALAWTAVKAIDIEADLNDVWDDE